MGAIPAGYEELLTRCFYAHVATVRPDGSPHTRPVWTDFDGERVLLNVNGRSETAENVETDPRVALSVLDPGDPYRYLALRGEVVGMRNEGAVDHVKQLAERYLGDSGQTWQYDGPNVVRVMLEIRPDDVTTRGNYKDSVPFGD